MKEKLRKYHRIIIAVFSTLLFVAVYQSIFSSNYSTSILSFQKKFSSIEKKLDRFAGDKVRWLNANKISDLKQQSSVNDRFHLHIYRHDSLIYWNTNQLPIIRFADIHFPSKGVLHLQNGWYYATIREVKNQLICASFLIRHDYSYENKDLTNEFSDVLNIPFASYITFEQESGFPIYSTSKNYLFSVHPHEYQTASADESIVLMILLLFCIGCWLYSLAQLFKRFSNKITVLLLCMLVGIRVLSLKFVWLGFMHDTDSFEPSLYGTNEWFPNFFEFLVNCIVIAFVLLELIRRLKNLPSIKRSKVSAWLFFLLSFPCWFLLFYLNKGLIENSSIPLVIDKLFSLSIYSVFALASLGSLFYVFYLLQKEIILLFYRLQVSLSSILFVGAFLGIAFGVHEMVWGQKLYVAAFLPLLTFLLLVRGIYSSKKKFSFAYSLLFLFLFSLVIATNLGEFNRRKERSERELYANQLASEKDIATEVEYSSAGQKLKADDFLRKYINSPHRMGISDFEDGIERRVFNGFWERYEMGFNLFNEQHLSIIDPENEETEDYDELNTIIEKHGSRSEIDSNVYFINDYTGHYSYIIKQPLFTTDSIKMVLICTLKSKKIPEEIGFPRLLISTKAKVFEPFQNYSIAKYYKSHLVTKYGKFNYPSSDLALNHWKELKTGYYDSDGYNHYVLQKNAQDVVVMSTKNFTLIELLTSVSYLFGFYGLLLLPIFYRFNHNSFFSSGFSLAFKIQLVFISLVFLSLLAFGWGSGVFVRDQYNEHTNDLIREKMHSVKTELRDKLGNKIALRMQSDGNSLEFLLQKQARVFVTDINLYDSDGHLLAASRPKVFNIGLLSEQINAEAYYELESRDKSEFIHQESIGKLNYSSAYTPFYNNDGKLLGFLNLQHFGQQKEFENQIQQFLVAIINIFMLLLALSIMIALLVSGWVTAPLRILQENFSKVKFGKQNQQILYDKEDEIGALVKDYNLKLDELEFTAQQLAKSERESAWREMAKQVAHEIKNPLTPMKLSIQQLQRIYDPTDPGSAEKLTRVSNSVIEQIDALAKIANEFSNFAKLPRPNEVKIDILPVLQNVVEVFKDEGKYDIIVESKLKTCVIMADKDQMIRVFNNLLKNAIQSIQEEGTGKITITVAVEEGKCLLEFSDNGIGISTEKHANIFVPYFTTKSTGTGLGLAMVKQIIENHRGEIWFKSIENEGTSFFITLPLVD